MGVYVEVGRKLIRTWWFWAFVLVVIPSCTFNPYGTCPDCPPPFDPGQPPVSSAIACDIPAPLDEGEDECATPEEADDPNNVSLTEAATALVNGKNSTFALDWTQGARDQCGGFPKKIKFSKPFPEGTYICLNCEQQIPFKYSSHTAACIAKCKDLVNFGTSSIPTSGIDAFCSGARTATNFDRDKCYDGACSPGGTLDPDFDDPRKKPEPVKWTDEWGTDDFGGSNSLVRASDDDFSAGAASDQIISYGDAWVEFEVTASDRSHVVGIRESRDSQGDPCFKAANCQDGTPGVEDAGFSIELNNVAEVKVLESSPTLTSYGPFGSSYGATERFRVRVKDNHDGSATIFYIRMGGNIETVFYQSQGKPKYPLRVNATLGEQGATAKDVNVVFIKP